MEAVLVALLATTIPSILAWQTRKASRNVDQKTETNHGKSAGEYLEMILDVRQGQLDLHQALIEHQEQDARNFKELAELIKENP